MAADVDVEVVVEELEFVVVDDGADAAVVGVELAGCLEPPPESRSTSTAATMITPAPITTIPPSRELRGEPVGGGAAGSRLAAAAPAARLLARGLLGGPETGRG